MSRTWTELRPLGDINTYPYSLAMSDNGVYILAVAAPFGSSPVLSRSANSGTTWAEIAPPDEGENIAYWTSCAVSRNGQYMLITERAGWDPVAQEYYGGKIFKSSDYGVTWTDITPTPTGQWFELASRKDCAISDDGLYIMTVVDNGSRMWSYDGGTTWGDSYTHWNWKSTAMSKTGQYQVCLPLTNGSSNDAGHAVGIRSIDYGNTWTTIYPTVRTAAYKWWVVDMSADGDTVIAGALETFGEGSLWLSFNFGATWKKCLPTGDVRTKWYGASCSKHGTHLIALNYGLRLWTSDDGNRTWTEERPAGDRDGNWYCCCMSDNGMLALVSEYGGRFWKGTLPAVPSPGFTSCYWDTQTSGQTTTAGTAVGKTTAQMETQSTFVNWDFTDTWNVPDSCYPWLRTQFVAVRNGCTCAAHSFPWVGKFQLSHVTA